PVPASARQPADSVAAAASSNTPRLVLPLVSMVPPGLFRAFALDATEVVTVVAAAIRVVGVVVGRAVLAGAGARLGRRPVAAHAAAHLQIRADLVRALVLVLRAGHLRGSGERQPRLAGAVEVVAARRLQGPRRDLGGHHEIRPVDGADELLVD